MREREHALAARLGPAHRPVELTGQPGDQDVLGQVAGGHDLRDPYVSPLFGDFSKGFPPTLLTAGTRDLFLSNAVRMHRALRAAGVPAELHILEAAPHGAFAGWPEVAELNRDVRAFCEARWRGLEALS